VPKNLDGSSDGRESAWPGPAALRSWLNRRRFLAGLAGGAAVAGVAAARLREWRHERRLTAQVRISSAAGPHGVGSGAAEIGASGGTALHPTGSQVIREENARAGTDAWRIKNYAAAGEIQAYADRASVNAGEALEFHVSTRQAGSRYQIEFYRMGWYGGSGARRISAATGLIGQAQGYHTGAAGLVGCNRRVADANLGLLDANWTPSYRLEVPSTWLSGIYLALLTDAGGKQTYVPFVVRQDERPSDLMFKASFNTYQAYNAWGSKSLYADNSVGPVTVSGGAGAVKVSFNRPFDADYGSGEFLRYEYNLLRWMERMGYDVSYIADGDISTNAALLSSHRGFISAGHDEYWTGEERRRVEAARDAGIHLAFLSGDAVYWQARYEPSASGDPNRTLVVYRTDADPMCRSNPARATVRWVDPPLNLPQHMLTGTVYAGQTEPFTQDWIVKDTTHWLFTGSGLAPGDRVRGLVGKEFDRVPTDMLVPPGIQILSHSPIKVPAVDRPPEVAFANTSVYKAPSGATVFSAGTVTWGWGLDDASFPIGALHDTPVSPAVQRITKNLLDFYAYGASPLS
jgi:hypothetical protein